MSHNIKALTKGEISDKLKSVMNLDILLTGTEQWFQQCQVVSDLYKQSYLELIGKNQACMWEIVLELEKVPELIYQLVSIQIWRQNVLPQLIEHDSQSTLRMHSYGMLFQEGPALFLLQDLVHEKPIIQSLDDYALDLIDYCAASTAVLVYMNNLKETLASATDVQGDIKKIELIAGMNSLSVLADLAEYVDELNVSAVVRMFSTHDIPLLMAQVIEAHPWKIRTPEGWQVYDQDNIWRPMTSDALPIFEAQCWICLRGLLLHPLARQHYELTPTRCSALQKLQKHLTETVIDQMAPLMELKQLLCRLAVTNDTSTLRPPLIVETLAPITSALLSQEEKWTELVDTQVKSFGDKKSFLAVAPYVMDILTPWDEIAKKIPEQQMKCQGCGKSDQGLKRCSRCKVAWYCSRPCQVRDWSSHRAYCQENRQ